MNVILHPKLMHLVSSLANLLDPNTLAFLLIHLNAHSKLTSLIFLKALLPSTWMAPVGKIGLNEVKLSYIKFRY